MSDGSGELIQLKQQLVDLQSQLAFQEDTVQALNDVVVRQQQQIDNLNELLINQKSQIELIADNINKDPETSEKPPHY